MCCLSLVIALHLSHVLTSLIILFMDYFIMTCLTVIVLQFGYPVS